MRGRIIVTGVGKSGHVARKIAATLASTGTPAQFVHAGEASHGDLGMIGADDAILALSNSGETAEFADIVAYSRRFGIPLIAMTGGGRIDARRGCRCRCCCCRPPPEACPMGLAPTTSTTMMMALGDALAIALLERRDFSSADFRVLHPGGRLGRRLLRVADIMHAGDEIPLVSPAAPMSEAILVMTARRVSAASARAMATGGWSASSPTAICAGIWAMRCSPARWRRSCIARRRRSPPQHSPPRRLGLMNRSAITSLFVVDDDGRPIGFLHMHDCLRAGIA